MSYLLTVTDTNMQLAKIKKSDGEQEKSGRDGEGERGQIIPNFTCVCL